MESEAVLAILEQMAEHGHAPAEGCRLFGVGYEDAFERLKEKYLVERFGRGRSAEKFIVGPFGSGKTHFLRQLLEIARDLGCVTSEVPLNKDLDFTHSLITYREVVREIRSPNGLEHGIGPLLRDMVDHIKGMVEDPAAGNALVQAWAGGLDKADFKLEAFGRVAKKCIQAHLVGDDAMFEAGCRWLGGEVADRVVARTLSESPTTKSEENLHGRRALLSLFQLLRHAKYAGTVVGFDEAEQGLSVDKRTMQRILSMLQSGINAMVDLQQGSALVIYALTPDIIESMEDFSALQQRVADPSPTRGFFDGETLAPRIDLARQREGGPDLTRIGRRLAEVLYEHAGENILVPIEKALDVVSQVAEDVALRDPSSSNRRTMVKRTCAMLLRLHQDGVLEDPGDAPADSVKESEV